MRANPQIRPLELWAGAECTVARVGDRYVDQLERTGHADRMDDLDRVAACGASAFRQGVLWERTAPDGPRSADFAWAEARLDRIRELGMRPIVGLLHHGSGPRGTSLVDGSFVVGFAQYARRVAERFPWVRDYTPINEPLTTARFAGLYGHWFPHGRSGATFARVLLAECLATRAAMRAIRDVNPDAQLVQTEDIGTIFATRRLAYQARFENQRRFLSLDLLTGQVDRSHPLWGWLTGEGGISERDLDDLCEEPCSPDVVGINYYVTSDRWLDERRSLYPACAHGGNGREPYADVEAVRVRARGIAGHASTLDLVARRYGLPLALTEVHLGGPPEQRIRWLAAAWDAAREVRARGVDVRAVTVWSAFGAYDWDSLLVLDRGRYEAGLYDVRGLRPRPTAVVQVARDLAAHGASDHPLLSAGGWWTQPSRLLYPAVGPAARPSLPRRTRPLVVAGARGTLGTALLRTCRERRLEAVGLSRVELDVADVVAVAAALDRLQPWAVVNAAGYVRVDDAEHERALCLRANAVGAGVLARACAARGVRLAAFSSDLVFDGSKGTPYVEGDAVRPLGAYGESKALAERLVLDGCPDALVVRTSAFFGPWDGANFLTRALADLRAGLVVRAADDVVVSPTYVPDLADAVLTLLIDGARGVHHLANADAVSWFELGRRAATAASVPTERLVRCSIAALAPRARRPAFSALASTRCAPMRHLDEAIAAFFEASARELLASTG